MRIFQYISILAFFLIITGIIYSNSAHYRIIKGSVFGTYYNIKIRTPHKNKKLKKEIEAKLEQINKQMSVFDTDSEISQINRLGRKKQKNISKDFAVVLSVSHKIWTLSDGYFDPTIGKLIDIWGFGTSKPQNPDKSEVQKALNSCGFDKLIFSNSYQTVQKKNKDVVLNLSAIAKGYAVDEVARILDAKGYKDYLVEIGGEIKAKGSKSNNFDGWTIGISKPQIGSNENLLYLTISNLAVATSGNYRNFYHKGGQTYVHTISPKNGYPVQNDALSATVFHSSCMYADAHATAIMSMGVKKGLDYADKNKLKVIIFDNNFNAVYSKEAALAFKGE